MVPEIFNLKFIAARLEGLEETIISKLIDRAQFSANLKVYKPGQSGFEGEPQTCLFDLRMAYQEKMDALFGRFCVPEERPFNKDLPETRRRVLLHDTGLKLEDFNTVNLTSDILRSYLELVPKICRQGSDNQYGSSVEHDVYALQAIARRIHFGSIYVAESKFQISPAQYIELIQKGDTSTIMDLLTRKDVEDCIVQRIREKTVSRQAGVNRLVRYVIDPELVVSFYRDSIIPLTKKGEIQYLMNRRKD